MGELLQKETPVVSIRKFISASYLKAYLIVLLVILLYFNTFRWLYGVYRSDPESSHGFLVPPIIGYLIWSNRRKLRDFVPAPSSLGLALIVLGVLLQLVSVRSGVHIGSILSFIITVWGIVICFLGRSFFRKLRFPLIYMLFLIPLPGLVQASLTFPMKLFASKTSTGVMRALGLSVFREGNVIVLPNYSFEVADACSGLRSMTSLLALGALLAYFTQRGLLKRFLLFSLSVPVAIIANIVRIVATGLLAAYVSGKVATGFLHEFSGVLVFMVAIVLMIALGEGIKLMKVPKFNMGKTS